MARPEIYVSPDGGLPGRPVFVGHPAAFDFMFVYWYLIRFTGSSPFSHSPLDMTSYAVPVLGTDLRATVTRVMPRGRFGEVRHSQVALDEAREQGALFCAMLAARHRAAGTSGPTPTPS